MDTRQTPLNRFDQIITVSLNPAVDRVVEVPGFHAGGHQRGRCLARYPAGKGVNVARAMAALQQPAAVVGFVGREEMQWYRQFLLKEGVDQCRLIPVEGRTRENITVVDPQVPNADTHIVEQGFSVTADDLDRIREALAEVATTGRLIVFGGSLPPGISVEQFAEMLRFCLEAGAKVAVDTSGAALRAAAELPLWLVKPNRQELAELTGSSLETHGQLLAAAAELTQRIRWILVSVGAEGAWLVESRGGRRAFLPLPAEKVVGTVGCGDVLLGGYLAGWQRGASASDLPAEQDQAPAALRCGVAAATYAATQLMRAIDTVSVKEFERDVEISSDRVV